MWGGGGASTQWKSSGAECVPPDIKVVGQLIIGTFSFWCFIDSVHTILTARLPLPQWGGGGGGPGGGPTLNLMLKSIHRGTKGGGGSGPTRPSAGYSRVARYHLGGIILIVILSNYNIRHIDLPLVLGNV